MPTLYYSDYSCADTTQQLIVTQFMPQQFSGLNLQKIPPKHSPLILVDNNIILNESVAISVHLAEGSNLLGTTIQEQIDIYSWLEFFNRELYPVLSQLNGQIFGKRVLDKVKFEYSLQQFKKTLKIMDDYLKIRTFFVGDQITLVDIVLCCQLQKAFRMLLDQESRLKLKNLIRWYSFVRNTSPFLQNLGKFFLCTQNFKPQFEQKQQEKKETCKKQESKESKKNEEKQQKKSETKLQSKKIEQTEEIKVEQTKKFSVDSFKRLYQNTEDKDQIIDDLLNDFPQGWSIWKVHYNKDPSQGKVDYLTSNMARGSLTRLEALKKTGFGTLGVYQSNQTKQYEIRGVMIWEGTVMAPAWKQHPSFEYHQFTKLNPSLKEDALLIKEYWLSKEKAEGLDYYDSFRLI